MMKKIVFSSPKINHDWLVFLFRVTLGVFFFVTGFNKLFVSENQKLMLETITEAGIFFPEIMAVFVSFCEFLLGFLLAIGLFTRLSAFGLLVISIVALITVGIHQIPPDLNIMTWYSWLFYLPESSYILLSLSLLVWGCGAFGIDRLIVKNN